MVDAHKNLAISAVAGAPSPATSGTSLSVSSGHGTYFPTPPFNALVWPTGAAPTPANAEIIRVTAKSVDAFTTIVRAQEGTSARTIVVGDQIAASFTAKALTDIEAVIATIVTDHGGLTGLSDDDHPHYLKERASGGAESEVPGHDHTATAKGGDIARFNDVVTEMLTGSGNWTVPAGTVGVQVELLGPGGGGGGADNDNAAGGGGGAGEYVRSYWTVAELGGVGANVPYSCGTGGGGGSNTGGDGSPGSAATSFGVVVTANPGQGGKGSTSAVVGAGGAGGTGGANYDIAIPGWRGFSGAGDNVGDGIGGKGADSPFGAGGAGGYDDGAGSNATGYGAGGGGAAEDDTTGQTGGSGSDGCIVLTIFKRS